MKKEVGSDESLFLCEHNHACSEKLMADITSRKQERERERAYYFFLLLTEIRCIAKRWWSFLFQLNWLDTDSELINMLIRAFSVLRDGNEMLHV